MSKQIHVVINPAAGQSEPVLSTLNQVFRALDIDWDVSLTHQAGDAERQSREAAEGGADIVVAYGGDGTVMEVANGLLDSDVPLAILPGGTGNVFSIELGIPQDLEAAARLAAGEQSQIRQVDVGQCGQRHFLLRMGTGFYAQRIQMTTRELRDRYGKMAYFLAGVQALSTARPVQYRFTLDGEEVEGEGYTCMVQNAGNLGIPGLSLASGIDVSDGLLDVIFVETPTVDDLASIVDITADKPLKLEAFRHWQVRNITIVCDPPQEIVGDGEPWGETPTSVEVLPAAIRVVVPQGQRG